MLESMNHQFKLENHSLCSTFTTYYGSYVLDTSGANGIDNSWVNILDNCYANLNLLT